MGGEAPQFSCQLRAIIGPCDHVIDRIFEGKDGMSYSHEDAWRETRRWGDWLKISGRMELKAV